MMLHVLVWSVWKTIMLHHSIRADSIDDKGITLRGIHPSFRVALWRWRHEQRAAVKAETAAIGSIFAGNEGPAPRELVESNASALNP
jgi:hypothetical protein